MFRHRQLLHVGNTVDLLKQPVYGGLAEPAVCSSMADGRTDTTLPDLTAILREERVERASVAVILNGRIGKGESKEQPHQPILVK